MASTKASLENRHKYMFIFTPFGSLPHSGQRTQVNPSVKTLIQRTKELLLVILFYAVKFIVFYPSSPVETESAHVVIRPSTFSCCLESMTTTVPPVVVIGSDGRDFLEATPE